MFLKKIIKNNKGIDVSLIGTAWILVLVISIAAILDLFIITYSKETVIMTTKSMQIYSLTSNFNHESVFLGQDFDISNNSQQAMISTFRSEWNKRFNKLNSKSFITNLTYHDNITLTVSASDRSVTITTPNITFKPKKIIKATTKIPFFGGNTTNYSNEEIHSGVSTKLKFLNQ